MRLTPLAPLALALGLATTGETRAATYVLSTGADNLWTGGGLLFPGGEGPVGDRFSSSDGNSHLLIKNYSGLWSDSALAADPLVVALAAIPEPAAWTLMIGGVGAAGALLRRRRAAAV